MDTGKLRKFAQEARRELIQQVTGKLGQVLEEGSLARREQSRPVKKLEEEIKAHGRDEVIERVAYTWFNRLCALRFMDARGYNTIRVVSPAEGQSQPEILAEAKSGHIDERTVSERMRERVFALLDKRSPSSDPQGEAYRLLLVAMCNHWHQTMPFMFEPIADYTELLMPDDLLSDNSVRTRIRVVMAEEDCQDVEIIGWLYQFYTSEKKDEVFEGLKKNQKITPENIPAATQLFTPHWIVRYLVENSLGRLWLLNRPQSRLAERMDYYIAPEEPETDFLVITRPEEIRICDPAAGSGHMLTYAFDLLYAIYEEEGYDATEIPALILTHNLTGVEIDDRAGALAAFALAMKAAARLGRRRFLRMEAKPDICVLQNVSFTEAEKQDVAAVVGKDLFTDELRETLGQFEQAKNFGSLIVPKLRDPVETLRVVEARDFGGDLLLKEMQERVVAVLHMADALSPKYHVVVANPPYARSSGLNSSMQNFAKKNYPDSKADLFAMFMERALGLAREQGLMGMINMQAWMFLSSFEKLRGKLLSNGTLLSMAHLGEHGFDTIGGSVVSTTAFVFQNSYHPSLKGDYVRLVEGVSEYEKASKIRKVIRNPDCEYFYRASAEQFQRIPGSPTAYWVSENVLNAYTDGTPLSHICKPVVGLQTGENDQFVREWHEVSSSEFQPNCSSASDANSSGAKWFPYNKGGEFRRWYGNHENVVNWQDDGNEIKNFTDASGKLRSRPQNTNFFFQPSVSWSKISSGLPAFRLFPCGFVFDVAGTSIFTDDAEYRFGLIGLCNSKSIVEILAATSPTLNFEVGHIAAIPIISWSSGDQEAARAAVTLSKSDWDAYETSWDFTTLPLLSPDHCAETLGATYTTLRTHWQGMTDEMQRLEEENNRIFIDAYGLQDELTPEVPLNEITLTCNPAYRYRGNLSDEERETRLRADTMAEFLSYAVGCMFGRYSLDAPGLILANQGETLADYLARVPEPQFMPDEDNIIPVLDGDWFPDDITERFREFLKITFGTERYEENLEFIENALGKDIRKYFLRDFYKDHVRRYKKRPIYWLFSSPKRSFNALIYMHRYRPETASVLLNNYLREFRSKLNARIQHLQEIENSASASARDKTAAMKKNNKMSAMVIELEDWERKVLLPLASEKIEIDLDDGVKANYPKFGEALAKIPGLSK